MSAISLLRDRIETIAGMMPLSDREKQLARMVIAPDEECDIETDVSDDPEWWGEESKTVLEHLK